MAIVTLTTDFGTRDYYVAAVKGVILSITPDACLVDVSHEVEPQNVLHGAFLLRQIWPWFPPGTVHLAVVDPGVGSSRRIIVGRFAGSFVVAPDNGLITFIQRSFPAEIVHVVEPLRFTSASGSGGAAGVPAEPRPSATFHGRDIMAPVAAHLAKGVDPREFGPLTDTVETLNVAYRAQTHAGGLKGSVLYVDRFGTLITNIHHDQIEVTSGGRDRWDVFVNGKAIGPIRSTFSDVAPNQPVGFVGSCGLLEIAVNRGSAAERFGRRDNVAVELRHRRESSNRR